MRPPGACAWCGAPLPPPTGGPGRPRRYCADAHKRAAEAHARKLRAPESTRPPSLAHRRRLAHARLLATQSSATVAQPISPHHAGRNGGGGR